MDQKNTSAAFARMVRSAVPKLFERDPNLSLVNTSRCKPETKYEKNIWLYGWLLAV